jgi:hypothetical protein
MTVVPCTMTASEVSILKREPTRSFLPLVVSSSDSFIGTSVPTRSIALEGAAIGAVATAGCMTTAGAASGEACAKAATGTKSIEALASSAA